MTILYNCHTDGTEFRITKFNDGEVESSYLCSHDECQCPAGHRPTCRHRMMLPMFIARDAINTWWFLDFKRKGWVSNDMSQPAKSENERWREMVKIATIDITTQPHSPTVTTAEFDSADGSSILPAVANKPSWRRI